jgi:hypothetical protein
VHIPDIDPDAGTLDAALRYAAAGLYVLPVTAGSKNPGSVVGKGWQHKSSTDPQTITAWFAGTDHGVAIHVGRSGLVVADIDQVDKLPDILADAAAEHWPPTQQTRHGIHHVYATPPGRTLSNGLGRLGNGWGEIRGRNGVILGAPSQHPDGGRYRWLHTGDIPVLPDAVAALLDDATDATDAASDTQVDAFLDTHVDEQRPELLGVLMTVFLNAVAQGESRHTRMVSVATGAMSEARAGLYPARKAAEALETLFLDAVTTEAPGKATRTPAVARSEWRGILAWAVAQAQAADLQQVRARAAQQVPADNLTFEVVVGRAEEGTEPDPFADAISLTQLDAMTFAPPSYLVDKILPKGGITLLAGAPKIGKSYLALGVALAVAQNGLALNRLPVTGPGGVLFISLDDANPARAQQRARQINYGRPLPSAVTLHTAPNLGQGKTARDQIARYLDRHPRIRLVIIDTLTHLRENRRANESVYDADVRWMATLRTLLDGHDCTFLCLAHIRKERADDGVMSVSGTYGVTGGADSLIILTGNRNAPGRIVEVVNRDDAGGEYALSFTDHGLILTDEDPHDPARMLSADDARVYRALEEFGPDGASAGELSGALGGPMTKMGNRLGRMAHRGIIRRLGRGRYAAN